MATNMETLYDKLNQTLGDMKGETDATKKASYAHLVFTCEGFLRSDLALKIPLREFLRKQVKDMISKASVLLLVFKP